MKNTTLRGTMLVAAAVTGLAGALSGAGPAQAQDPQDSLSTWLAAGLRPMIGISYHPVAALPGTVFGSRGSRDEGLVIVGLRRGGPAESAGIRPGDRIVAVNGQRLDEPVGDKEPLNPWAPPGSRQRARLMVLLGNLAVGEPVELEVERDGELATFSVTPVLLASVEDLEEPPGMSFFSVDSITLDSVSQRFRAIMDDIGTIGLQRPGFDFDVGWVPPMTEVAGLGVDRDFPLNLTPRMNRSVVVFGADEWRDRFADFGGNIVEVVQLNAELGSYFGTEEGVLVLDVDGASTLGLRPGDVVVKIGGRQVDDVSDMRRILDSYEDDEKVDFGIWRDGAEATVVGTIR